MLFLGDPREGGRGMLVTLDVYLLLSLGKLLGQITQEGGGSDLHCRLSPGFHQKVETGSLRGYVSSRACVGVRSRILLTLASIVLAFNSVSMLL